MARVIAFALLFVSACWRPEYVVDFGPDDGYYFRCMGRCHGKRLYDVRMSADGSICACRHSRVGDPDVIP